MGKRRIGSDTSEHSITGLVGSVGSVVSSISWHSGESLLFATTKSKVTYEDSPVGRVAASVNE